MTNYKAEVLDNENSVMWYLVMVDFIAPMYPHKCFLCFLWQYLSVLLMCLVPIACRDTLTHVFYDYSMCSVTLAHVSCSCSMCGDTLAHVFCDYSMCGDTLVIFLVTIECLVTHSCLVTIACVVTHLLMFVILWVMTLLLFSLLNHMWWHLFVSSLVLWVMTLLFMFFPLEVYLVTLLFMYVDSVFLFLYFVFILCIESLLLLLQNEKWWTEKKIRNDPSDRVL